MTDASTLNGAYRPWLSPCTNLMGQQKPPELADFERVSKLGKGAYGQVFRVKHRPTSQEFALKVISKQVIDNLRMVDQLKNEFNILRKLNHENIIQLIAHFEDNRNIYFLLELAEDDHLYSRLNKVGSYDEPIAAKHIFDMFKAVNYLHNMDPPIIHRDIKPENILFVNGSLKLADFGWSNVKDQKARTTYCGTPDYLAPEMVSDKPHNEKLDVWTLGVLLFELVSGKAPFTPAANIKDKRLVQKELNKNIIEVKYKMPTNISAECQSLIKKILQRDAANRPSCAEALVDPFFRKYGLNFEPKQAVKTAVDPKAAAKLPAGREARSESAFGEIDFSTFKAIKDGGSNSTTASSAAVSPLPTQSPQTSNGSIGNSQVLGQSSITQAVSTDTLLLKVSEQLRGLFKTDKEKFSREMLRAYVEVKENESQLRQAMEVHKQAMNRAIEEQNKQNSKIKDPQGGEVTQEQVLKLFKAADQLAELKKELATLQEAKKKLEDNEAKLSSQLTEAHETMLVLQSSKDELESERTRFTGQQDELKKQQQVLEQDWLKEKEALVRSNQQLQDLLSQGTQTRPALIQSSLLKVIDALSDFGSGLEATAGQTEWRTAEALSQENQTLKRRLEALEREGEKRLRSEVAAARAEEASKAKLAVEETRLLRETEAARLEAKLDEMKAQLEQIPILQQKTAHLDSMLLTKDSLIEEHKRKADHLANDIKKKQVDLEISKETIQELMMRLETSAQNRHK